MSKCVLQDFSYRRKCKVIGTLAVALLLCPSAAQAAGPAGSHAVEEDWRVELYTVSDPIKTTCPLFVSGFALPNLTTLFQVTWNHRDLPELEQGGIQLQAYRWENLLAAQDVVTPPWRDKLSTNGEVVTWTQGVRKDGLAHVFSVKNIAGTTWGTIAQQYSVRRTYLQWAPTFETYDLATIKKNSAIVMGTNRFKKLSITQTRFYDSNGQLLGTDANEHIIFQQAPTYAYFEARRLGE